MKKGYDLIGLYHDADDPRAIVPKRVKAMGWTVNVSSTGGRIILGAVVLVIAVLAVLQYG